MNERKLDFILKLPPIPTHPDLESYSYTKVPDTTTAMPTTMDMDITGYTLVTGAQGDGQRFSNGLTDAATLIQMFDVGTSAAVAVNTCLAACTADATCGAAMIWLTKSSQYGCQHMATGGELRSTSLLGARDADI